MEKNTSKQNSYINILNIILQQVFGIFLIGYLFFFLINQVFDNFVSNFINLNYILVVVIVSGILLILFKGQKEIIVPKNQESHSWKYSILSFFLGLIAGIIIFIQIITLGILLSVIISIISGVLIALLSFSLLDFDESKNEL